MNKETIKGIMMFLFITAIVLFLPLMTYYITGDFTFNVQKAFEELEQREEEEQYRKVAETCDFMITRGRYGYECMSLCLSHSLDGKNCVPKGCIGGGLFSRMDCDLYVCEGYGDITPQCLSYYQGSKEDYCKEYPGDGFYCPDEVFA